MHKATIRDFLALPPEALPAARFTDEDDSYAHDAWAVLRAAAKSGESVTSLCGTTITVHADRKEWANVVFA